MKDKAAQACNFGPSEEVAGLRRIRFKPIRMTHAGTSPQAPSGHLGLFRHLDMDSALVGWSDLIGRCAIPLTAARMGTATLNAAAG